MLLQMAELLLAPGCAVAVLENDLPPYATPMGSNERPGHFRQRQLLNSHFDAVLSCINGVNQKLFQVISVAPFIRERRAIAIVTAVIERRVNCCSSA